MSCDCTRRYAGPTQDNSGTLSSIPPTGSAGDAMGSTPVMASHFCWKCFAFWGSVALVVLFVISEGDGE